MRARGVTTPLLIATASSSIDLNTVSSPGESSIRYMPDLMSAGFRAKKEVLRSAISRNFRARVRCTFVHAELTDRSHCNRCIATDELSNHQLLGTLQTCYPCASFCSLPRRQKSRADESPEMRRSRSGKLPVIVPWSAISPVVSEGLEC